MDTYTKINYARPMTTETELTPVAAMAVNTLSRWGHQIPTTTNGPDEPSFVEILAWKMAAQEVPIQIQGIEEEQERLTEEWNGSGPMPDMDEWIDLSEFCSSVLVFMCSWAVQLGAPMENMLVVEDGE